MMTMRLVVTEERKCRQTHWHGQHTVQILTQTENLQCLEKKCAITQNYLISLKFVSWSQSCSDSKQQKEQKTTLYHICGLFIAAK